MRGHGKSDLFKIKLIFPKVTLYRTGLINYRVIISIITSAKKIYIRN